MSAQFLFLARGEAFEPGEGIVAGEQVAFRGGGDFGCWFLRYDRLRFRCDRGRLAPQNLVDAGLRLNCGLSAQFLFLARGEAFEPGEGVVAGEQVAFSGGRYGFNGFCCTFL